MKLSKSCFFFTFLFLMVCNLSVKAQQRTVTGTVIANNGDPVPGVSVMQKGTKNGTATDFDGNYSIKLLGSGSKVLVFASLGFKDKEVAIGNRTKINITIEESSEQLDEIVVIGYGTANKRDVLGSMASVKTEVLNESVPVDALGGLQGRVSGVQILTNGAPGSSSEIVIRGISTLNSGTGPLYVVDGQQVDDIDNINPNDIESLEVLKDGASAAIYGSRSANGVVLVTTKKGKVGLPTVKVSVVNSLSYLKNKVPVSNTVQRNKFIELRQTGNTNASGGTVDSLGIRTQFVVDLQELIKQVGQKTQANVAFSGGSENAKYYWNTGFLDEEGIIIGSNFRRINTNLNLSFDITKKLSAGTRLTATYQNQDGIPEGTVFRELSYRQTDVLVYDYDGSFIRERFARNNPIARAVLGRQDNRQYRASSFNWFNYQFTPEFSFKTTIGVNFRLQKLNEFRPSQTVDAVSGKINGRERQRLSYDIQSENFFNYSKKFKGGHKFTGLVGFSVQKWHQENSDLRAIEFNNDYLETFNNVKEFNLTNTGTTAFEHSLVSLYSRLTYDYKRKYLIGATLRRDASSRFGENKRWGDFPSVSAGWRISNEKFIKDLDLEFLQEFKLRASYAITGNERIGNYLTQALYGPGNFYDGVSGFAPFQLGNADLGWEETAQQNYGVDLNLFGRRLKISVDHYIKTTTDLLYARPIPEETGFSSITANIGSIENKGFDVEISGTPLKTADFEWYSGFNVSYNKNKILKLADPDGHIINGSAFSYKLEVGQPIGSMYGFKNLGVYQYDESNAYTESGTRLTANFDENDNFVNYLLNGQEYNGTVKQQTFNNVVLKGGDVIWQDQNGDLNIDQENDRTIIGNGLAEFVGGWSNTFSYKNLSLSVLLNYSFGQQIYRGYDHTRNKANNSVYTPGPDRIEDAWLNQGDITRYPSLEVARAQNRTGLDSDYVSNADYIRLQNVRLSYKFSKEVLDKVDIFKSLSMSVVANNLLTFTNYTGYNPELGNGGNNISAGLDNLRYPNKTSIIFSLTAQF
ncbi:SusC/RagA family TonB-linked outer membrane protein [Polaribacter butkevichii]|nr:TonB-dependent receptor [Polaribacter butkevichii]